MAQRRLDNLPSILFKAIMPVCILIASTHISLSQVIINSGADFSIKPDAIIIVKSLLRNNGYLGNESKIIIEGDFNNNDTAEGLGIDTFDITGDWINNKAFVAGQSAVVLSGGNQTIKGDTATVFYNLALAGTGVKSLDTVDAIVSNHLALNDLELATKTKKLIVTSMDSNAISRINGFVSSLNGGFLERYMGDTLEYLYPLGSNSGTFRYRPLVITPDDSGTVAIAARLANVDATTEGYDLAARSEQVCEINPLYYHQIERSLDSIPVSVTMFYDPATDGLWPEIAHWQNSPRWELAGLTSQNSDFIFNTVTINNYENFDYSPFALMKAIPILDSTETIIIHSSCNNGNDGSICVSDTPLTGTPPFLYSWSNGATTPCVTGLAAGDYTLELFDSSGCASMYSFTINQPNNIFIDDTVTDVSCKGGSDGSICVSIDGDFPPFSFSWFGVPGDSCFTGLEKGPYSVTVTDSTGCMIVLQNIIVEEPDLLLVSAQGTDVTCNGFDNGQGIATPTGGVPPYHYQWVSFPDDTLPNDTLASVAGLSPGSYGVTVADDNGCIAVNSISIDQPASLSVVAGPDKIIYTGFTTSLEVISVAGGLGDVTYQWEPTTGVENPTQPATITTPDASTTYTIRVTDENGCVAYDTLQVQVDVNLYTFPDAFVPNGSNRIFIPVTSETVQLTKLQIFNRWGQLISEDATGWDGKYEGKLQPMDTYVYQAVLQLPDGSQKTETGDFVLIW